MTPEHLEINALNRELGEAEGLLEALAVNQYDYLSERQLKSIKAHIQKVEHRKSHLQPATCNSELPTSNVKRPSP